VPIQPHLTFVSGAQPGNDVAERAFASAILSNQSMNFTRLQIEIDVNQDRSGVRFAEATCLQEWSHVYGNLNFLAEKKDDPVVVLPPGNGII
jgi:hypothetical protein